MTNISDMKEYHCARMSIYYWRAKIANGVYDGKGKLKMWEERLAEIRKGISRAPPGKGKKLLKRLAKNPPPPPPVSQWAPPPLSWD